MRHRSVYGLTAPNCWLSAKAGTRRPGHPSLSFLTLPTQGWRLEAAFSKLGSLSWRDSCRGTAIGSLGCSASDLLPHIARARRNAGADAKAEEDRRLDADQRKKPGDWSGDEHCANAGDERRCEMLDGVDETKLTLNEGSGLEVAKRRNGESDGHADDREHVSTPGQRISSTRTPASAHSFTLANDDTSVARRDWSRVRATRKLSGY